MAVSYQLTHDPGTVIETDDAGHQSSVPASDPAYQFWLDEGNTPLPATPLPISFEAAEDAERLRTVNERARTDPAYAALAELALRGWTR